jgi:hypothetical protein
MCGTGTRTGPGTGIAIYFLEKSELEPESF